MVIRTNGLLSISRIRKDQALTFLSAWKTPICLPLHALYALLPPGASPSWKRSDRVTLNLFGEPLSPPASCDHCIARDFSALPSRLTTLPIVLAWGGHSAHSPRKGEQYWGEGRLERSKGPGCGGVRPTSELGFDPTVTRETLEALSTEVTWPALCMR